MKILLVNKFFFNKGGAETVYFQERDMLKEAGYQTIELSMQHEKNFESDYADYFVQNVDYHGNSSAIDKIKAGIRFIHNSEACQKMQQLLEKERPDLVHFHNIYHQLTPSIIKVAKDFGCKTVLTAHDTKIVCPNYNAFRDGKPCEKCLEGTVFNATKYRCQEGSLIKSFLLTAEALYQGVAKNYHQLDALITPSAFLGHLIRRKLPDNRIEVIVNGIDERLSPDNNQAKGYFLYFGRLSNEKGVMTLAKAYSLLPEEKKLPLKLVGSGPLHDDIAEKYPEIELLGFRSGDDLVNLIKGATTVVLSSTCYENCSMSVLESFAYGKPVVGARIGGIPEQIRDGQDGLLFEAGNPQDLAEKLTYFVDHPEASKVMGDSARQRLEEKYSLTKHKQALLDLYRDLLVGE